MGETPDFGGGDEGCVYIGGKTNNRMIREGSGCQGDRGWGWRSEMPTEHLPPRCGQFCPPCAPPQPVVGAPLSAVTTNRVDSQRCLALSAAVTLPMPSLCQQRAQRCAGTDEPVRRRERLRSMSQVAEPLWCGPTHAARTRHATAWHGQPKRGAVAGGWGDCGNGCRLGMARFFCVFLRSEVPHSRQLSMPAKVFRSGSEKLYGSL